MATALVMEFPKATQRQYDEVIDALGLKDPHNLPRGLIFHVAGPTESGWEVIEVWESRAHFDRFVEQRLGAAVREVGLPAPRPVLIQYIGETSLLPGALEALDDLEGSPVAQRLMGMNGVLHFIPG